MYNGVNLTPPAWWVKCLVIHLLARSPCSPPVCPPSSEASEVCSSHSLHTLPFCALPWREQMESTCNHYEWKRKLSLNNSPIPSLSGGDAVGGQAFPPAGGRCVVHTSPATVGAGALPSLGSDGWHMVWVRVETGPHSWHKAMSLYLLPGNRQTDRLYHWLHNHVPRLALQQHRLDNSRQGGDYQCIILKKSSHAHTALCMSTFNVGWFGLCETVWSTY